MDTNEESCHERVPWTKRLPAIIGLSSLIFLSFLIARDSSGNRSDRENPSIRIVTVQDELIVPQISLIYCGTMQHSKYLAMLRCNLDVSPLYFFRNRCALMSSLDWSSYNDFSNPRSQNSLQRPAEIPARRRILFSRGSAGGT